MKKIIVSLMTCISIVCILFSVSFTTFANDFNVQKQDYISGNVSFDSTGKLKKYTEGSNYIEYTYDKNGNITKTVEYDDQFNCWIVQDYSFNSMNKVVKSNYWFWYGKGEANSRTLQNTYTYTYDSSGNLIKKVLKYSDGDTDTTTYAYDSSGNLIKKVFKYSNGDTDTNTYTYDSSGRLTKISSKTYGGMEATTSYTYDSSGRLVKEVYKHLYIVSDNHTISNTYDSSGNLIKKTYDDTYGTTTNSYTYDSSGNLLNAVNKDSSGNTSTTSYTYDSSGNLVKKVLKHSGGDSDTTTYTYDKTGKQVKKVYDNAISYNYSYQKANGAVFFLNDKDYFSPDPIFDQQDCVILFDAQQDYTGTAITPSVAVFKPKTAMNNGGYDVAVNGVDYTVSYSNNTKAGTGKIKIHFLISGDFEEYPKDVELPFTICSHSYQLTSTKAATCSEAGTKTYTCTSCKATRTETIAKLGHSYSTSWTTDKKATCTETGSKSHHCTRCNAKTDVTSIAKKAHTYDNGKITKASTCTVKGVKTYTCTVCKATKTETVDLKAHTYKSTVTKATTSKDGKVVKACSVCKKSTSTVIPKVSSITIDSTSYTYNGSVRTPSVTVKDSKGKVLKNGTDYTVTYSSGRKEVGSYTAKVTLKGNYSGSKTFTFKISLGKVTGLKQTSAKGIGLSWGAISGATGYEVVLKTNNGSTTKTTTKTTLSSASAKGSAQVKVRAYRTINGKKVYGAYSSTITVKAK